MPSSSDTPFVVHEIAEEELLQDRLGQLAHREIAEVEGVSDGERASVGIGQVDEDSGELRLGQPEERQHLTPAQPGDQRREPSRT